MSQAPAVSSRVLVVEDDADMRDTLQVVLEEEGYEVHAAATLDEALDLLDRHAVQLVLTDLFAVDPADPLRPAERLRQQAQPLPVGVVTGWNLDPDVLDEAGFAFLLAKPFNLDDLVARVAGALHVALTPEQERQAAVAQRYFDALSARDWDALVALCTEDVTYTLPGNTPFSGVITGREAFRTYSEETFRHFPAARFGDIVIFALPRGLAVRYIGSWQGATGETYQQSGAVVFHFAGERIAGIGVQLNTERLRRLSDV